VFERYPSSSSGDRDFCSKDCANIHRGKNIRGENHPNWTGGKVEVECHTCGESLKRKRVNVEDRDNQFCDHECYGEWRSENVRGEEHPNFNPDVEDIDYGENWWRKRRECLERDGYQCATCGMSREEHKEEYGRDLSVHHRKKIREFDTGDGIDHERANDLSNLVTLCYGCHNIWENMTVQPHVE
jgi:endogenous inhibitor of DNA gyrase (YacG/DUF329 family)